ncbi:hypothetical protein Fmac_024828 [Flemingia macrophylla]|uniref:Uncharacterized protein n=1 Tax=Flemingia macrophylla TaxID=520843 RepID=A0ABD1LQH0_9FABA
MVACYRCLQHKPQDAHSLQVATKKDRHLYGGHWKNGWHRLLQQRDIRSHVVNSSNDNDIISYTGATSWKPSSLSSVWPLLLWWPGIDVCSISLKMLIHSRLLRCIVLEAIFSVKCLASAAVVACDRIFQHKAQDAHLLQFAMKKDRHLCIYSHVVNSSNDNGIISCTETARSWKLSSLSSVWPWLLWWPAIDVCSISLRMLIHSRCICSHVVNFYNDNGIISCTKTARISKPSSLSSVWPLLLWLPAIDVCSISLRILIPSSFDARNDATIVRGVHHVATDTSAETRKVEGKLDALANLVNQLEQPGVNEHPEACAANIYSSFGARNDAIVIRGLHDVATDTSAETRKVEGKLDALANLVNQLMVNQKPASVARVCGIRSSNHHHTNVFPSFFGARNDAIVIRGVHDVATDTSAETRKVECKLDALVNLVTQLAMNQKPASVARVCHQSSRGQTLDREDGFQLQAVSVQEMMPLSLEEFTTCLQIHLLKLERSHHRCRGQTLDREDGFQLLAVSVQELMQFFGAINDAIAIRGVHNVAKDTSAETRKVEGKLDVLVNLVTQVDVNQKSTSIARVYGHHISSAQPLDREDGFQLLAVAMQEMMPLSLEEFTTWLQIHLLKLESFSARNDAIVIRGVHDVATDTFAKTRKVKGKLDPLVNLVTQLVVNQKRASVARVCGIRSSNAHHTNVSRNDAVVIRGFHDIATDTSVETRKVEGKLDALVDLVTQVDVNQKPASVARVYVSEQEMMPLSLVEFITWLQIYLLKLESFSARNDAIVIRGVHNVATDTSAETGKVEGKLNALVKMVTQLAVNQKPASVARATKAAEATLDREDGFQLLAVSVQEMMSFSFEEFTTWLQIHLLKLERSFGARNDVVVIRGFHDMATDTFVETRTMEGKLDALVNLVTQVDVNQKPASVARVYGICSSHDHHINVCPSSFRARNDAIVISGVHNVATDTSAETRKSVASIPPMTTIQMPVLLHSNLDISARNDAIVIRGVHNVATDTSAETGKVEGKLNALVKMVTQLAVNQKPASIARATKAAEATLDREDGFQLLAVSVQEMMPFSLEEFTTWLQIHLLKLERSFGARNDAIIIRGVHNLPTDTSAENRKVEGKLDPHVNLVTQLAVNLNFGARNDAIVIRGVDDVATYTSAKTRKVEGKLDNLVNLVTQLAVNQKSTPVVRVCGIRHHSCRGQSLDREDGFQLLAVSEPGVNENLRLMLQTSTVGNHSSIGQTLDREDGIQLLAVSVQDMMTLSLEEFTTWLQIHLLKLTRWKASSCQLGDSTRCESEA